MSTNYDMDALFHPKVEIRDIKSQKNIGEYSPTADKGQNGIYKSIIRFVAWWQDPHNSYVEKWSCWLTDPITNRGRMVDCPSSVGKPSPLQDMFFKLRKSDSIQEQKKSEIFSRKHQYAAIIQVIKDDQNKEAEGKLFVYQFGKKIFEKYEAEKKPLLGEAHEPFDLMDGKAFALVITKVSGFNNYDQSKFLDKKIPLLIPNEDGKLIPINEKTPRETVFNFLKENSPDLNKYKYKEWDQDTHDYVNQIILGITGQVSSTTFADIRNKERGGVSAMPTGNKPLSGTNTNRPSSGITVSDITLEDLDINSSISDISNLDIPDLNFGSSHGIAGDLDDALLNL